MSEKPETEAVVKEKLSALHSMWEELESTTQTKAQCLFDANKAELFTQSCADLDKWMGGLEGQIQSDDYGKDLTSVNILLKKQQVRRQDYRSTDRSWCRVTYLLVVFQVRILYTYTTFTCKQNTSASFTADYHSSISL